MAVASSTIAGSSLPLTGKSRITADLRSGSIKKTFFFHSVEGENADDMVIGIGDSDLVKIYEQKKYAEVEAYYMHPEYNSWTIRNDIALIKLKEPLRFTDAVQPACLPFGPQEHYDGILKVISNLNLFKL